MLNRMALFCALVGIFLLFAYANLESPRPIKISDISERHIDTKVTVKGVVAFSKTSGSALLFAIDDGAKINCVFFKPGTEEKIIIQKGNYVEVDGKVKRYKDNLEIVAEKVRLLD